MSGIVIKKSERLKSRKIINELFFSGKMKKRSPVSMNYLLKKSSDSLIIKTGFAVSKKNFKKATDRNLIKRRLREAFRKNEHILFNGLENINAELCIMFVFQGTRIEEFYKINDSIVYLLDRISVEFQNP